MIKEQIERLIKYERRDCRTDDAALFDLILEHARVQQRFYLRSAECPVPQTRLTQQPKKTQKMAKPSQPMASKKARTPSRDGCLVCRDQHWLDECPTATPEQRVEALAKLRAAKSARQDALQSKAESVVARMNMVRNDAIKSLSIDVEHIIEQLAAPGLLDEEKDEFPVGDELPAEATGEDEVLDHLVTEAAANGMDARHEQRLRVLVHEHADVFRASLGDDPLRWWNP
ncbi:unnamed protein product [Phytophthora fragariaefolia]|uniref:Unnamed protein product n=1 Tax=Phytophthora fragariaefolia TaxID=1490495 RepID=A0A9W7CYC5_9STRA|nr:unnamed protein product [Phytophthora fragariaefolia]